MRVAYVEPFVRAARDVFKLMMDLEATRGELWACDELMPSKEASVAIGVTGDLLGSILYSFPKEMTLKMVEIMSGMAIEELDSFVASALGEVANIISDVIVLDQGRVILNQPVEDVLAKTHSVVGPEKDVEQYTKGLNVIGHDMMGTIRANYVYGDLDDRILPDTVQLSNFDLQKLFIFLTNQYEGSAKNEDK